jgi:hypothetical protein
MKTKSLRAIYCDDIRNEVGGKVSLMGVYSGDMIIPSFPTTMAKFCAQITLQFPRNAPPKQGVVLRLLSGEAVLAEAGMDQSALAGAPLPPTDPEIPEEDAGLAMVVTFMLAPLQVNEPIKISLRAIVDGEEMKGNAIKIRTPTEEELQGQTVFA